MTDEKGREYHQMIKYDALRYISHGAEIKDDLDNNKNFLKLEENILQNIYPKNCCFNFYIFDINLYEDFQTKKINTGIYKPYIFIQCVFYYLCLLIFFNLLKYFEHRIYIFCFAILSIRTKYFTISRYFLE